MNINRKITLLLKHKKMLLLILAIFIVLNIILLYVWQYIPPLLNYKIMYLTNRSQVHKTKQYIELIISTTLESNATQVEYNKLVAFLKTHINTHPHDLYNSSYLEKIGNLYLLQDAIPQANYYYTLSITKLPYNKYPIINQKKITTLTELTHTTDEKIYYYTKLLDLYPSTINSANIYYALGRLHDELSDWDKAYYYYNLLLKNSAKLSVENSESIVEELYFRNRRKRTKTTNTWNTVQEARRAVQAGFYSRNGNYVNSLKSPGFFTTQWQESTIDSNAQIPNFNLAQVLVNSNISFTNTFSAYSTSDLVLWNTVGWARVGTWYMVFRKIKQPDTISINGRWEWAGIFFGVGNKFYVPN